MKEIRDMSPAEYREARAAMLRNAAQISIPKASPGKSVLELSPAEYDAARRQFIARNGA